MYFINLPFLCFDIRIEELEKFEVLLLKQFSQGRIGSTPICRQKGYKSYYSGHSDTKLCISSRICLYHGLVDCMKGVKSQGCVQNGNLRLNDNETTTYTMPFHCQTLSLYSIDNLGIKTFYYGSATGLQVPYSFTLDLYSVILSFCIPSSIVTTLQLT